ncbi:helix-turn-helix domain-containing protein [Chitinophaga vietnamensis]|uniref:helix-turn-helix domain-containing protein n=1 Tax=Chitinophaga vietnamensis TaxID=2593957 RepID=UPI00137623FE|nr:AraC family transcriptional regulator [Chitinophaga vietnamensis]
MSKCAPSEWPNVISLESSIGEVSRRSVAPLSIKCSLKGKEIFEVGGSTKIVDAHSYLIVNEWQPYTASILDDQTESLCVFFNNEYSHNVVSALLSSDEKMLENTPADWRRSFDFFEKLYSHDQCVSPALYKVARAIKDRFHDPNYYDQVFYLLLEQMVRVKQEIHREMMNMPFTKRSTQLEIMKRVFSARDFLDSCYQQKISLDEAARAACLSKYYFLRAFKMVYKETPYHYLTRRRLKAATDLLSSTSMPVEEVSLQAGFEDHRSFLKLFRKYYLQSPTQFRGVKKPSGVVVA